MCSSIIDSGPDLRPTSASETSMPVVQSIELAREERIGGHGVAPKALYEAIARTAGAPEWPRARPPHGKPPPPRPPRRRAGPPRGAHGPQKPARRPTRAG